jgi:hypothetical protein
VLDSFKRFINTEIKGDLSPTETAIKNMKNAKIVCEQLPQTIEDTEVAVATTYIKIFSQVYPDMHHLVIRTMSENQIEIMKKLIEYLKKGNEGEQYVKMAESWEAVIEEIYADDEEEEEEVQPDHSMSALPTTIKAYG